MVKKISKFFECSNCGAQTPKWNGRCFECGSWGSLKEKITDEQTKKKEEGAKVASAEIIGFNDIKDEKLKRIMTGIDEVDRVFGGGIVPGSISLISGEPGIGKSTLLTQIISSVAKTTKQPVLYISGEESVGQVKARFVRLGCKNEMIKFVNETNVEKIISASKEVSPSLMVVDSIQTTYSALADSEPGSIGQIKASTLRFLELAKERDVPIILVGHITKDGNIAGPKSLEHIVDTVIYLETDNTHYFRILRSSKNRFGSTNELGVFEMTDKGFVEVKNTSSIFLEKNSGRSEGTAIGCIMEGTRPFLVEVQSLVTKTVFGYPQRKSQGFDVNRLQILAAILVKQANVNLTNKDIILNIVGGLRIQDTSMDLAACFSLVSSYYGIPLDEKSVFIGEVGLNGEVRNVSRLEERVKEAKKLGYKKAFIPDRKVKTVGINIVPIKNVREIVEMFEYKKKSK